MPTNYPVRSGKEVRTVADLVEAEKLACRAGGDASLRMLGLAYYLEETEWQNDLGENWSLERMVRDELARPAASAPEGGLNRLMGLSFAVSRRLKHGQPIDSQFQRAEKYVTDFQHYAFQLQNADGSWGPNFLANKSTSQDAAAQLRSNGRVLEWLVISLPDKQLEDAHVIAAVDYLARLLSNQRYQWNTEQLPTQEIASVGHALHALVVYDQREFKPADVPAKPAGDAQSPATASSDATPSMSR